MTDADYIKRAVELADGWESHGATIFGNEHHTFLTLDDQVGLDAVAAQLVRQVDALDDYFFVCDEDKSVTVGVDDRDFRSAGTVLAEETSDDRTMNTIKAIVDSGALSE